MSQDVLLTYGAMFVECGLPLGLVIAWFRQPRSRARIVVVAGAVTPPFSFYLLASAAYVISRSKDIEWAFWAMWLVSLLPFVLCATLGAALSFIRRPARLAPRYLIGLVAPLAVGGALAWSL
jgi:hypothetical protein